jgi:nitroimidazol reductase NimA-like FMN-containing flavoprotein (pyridoxamine 5'-phosphate oxidase superfamily)
MSKPATIDPERKAKIDAFLDQSILAQLATSSARTLQPHVVPLWYLWDGERIWIHSYASTHKIRDLRANPKCAVLVHTNESKDGLTAVLLEGLAELFFTPSDFTEETITRIYIRYLGPEGVLEKDPQEWIHSPESTLIKMTPQQIYSW